VIALKLPAAGIKCDPGAKPGTLVPGRFIQHFQDDRAAIRPTDQSDALGIDLRQRSQVRQASDCVGGPDIVESLPILIGGLAETFDTPRRKAVHDQHRVTPANEGASPGAVLVQHTRATVQENDGCKRARTSRSVICRGHRYAAIRRRNNEFDLLRISGQQQRRAGNDRERYDKQ